MYFDPGTGSLIIQAIIAALAVAGGYFAAVKLKLKGFFTKKKDKEITDGKPEDTDDTL